MLACFHLDHASRFVQILGSIIEALAGSGASYSYSIITIEHVLPQNPGINGAWSVVFPDVQIREGYVHRLGNLVLLARKKNSEAQNYDFNKKKDVYFGKGNVALFALTTQVISEPEWTPTVIEGRQRLLMDKLISIWRLN